MSNYNSSAEMKEVIYNKITNNTPVVSDVLRETTQASIQDYVGESTTWPTIDTMRKILADYKNDRVAFN